MLIRQTLNWQRAEELGMLDETFYKSHGREAQDVL